MNREIDFRKGRISFVIPKGAIDYKDNKQIKLINFNSNKGFIRVLKNKKNDFVVEYNYNPYGGCSLYTNVEELNNKKEHHIVISWSIKEGKLKLFIDSNEMDSCDIIRNPKTELKG